MWQPIETAPKDKDIWVYGTAKVWSNSDEFLWQGQSGWNSEDSSWWTTSHDDCGEVLIVKPSHWMPLPQPPEAE